MKKDGREGTRSLTQSSRGGSRYRHKREKTTRPTRIRRKALRRVIADRVSVSVRSKRRALRRREWLAFIPRNDLNLSQAAEHLRVSRTKLRTLIETGPLVAYRSTRDGRLWIRPEDLAAYRQAVRR